MGDIMSAFNQAVGLTDDPADVQRQSAQMQYDAAHEANALQREMWETGLTNQKPWLEAGTSAVNRLSTGLASGGEFATTPQFQFNSNSVDVTQDPGYKFRLQSGVDALRAGSAAGGNYMSGNMGVALTQYGQNLGSQEYGAAYDRAYTNALDSYNAAMAGQNTLFNRLSGVSGTGQVTANQLMSSGQNTATNMGANLTNAAASAGNNLVGAAAYTANQYSAAGNQLGAIGNQIANYYAQQNALQNAQGYNALGNYYSAAQYSDGYNGVYGGEYAGTDMYAGDLY